MELCGILSLVVAVIGIFAAVLPCGIGAVVLGVIGTVGSKSGGIKALSIIGIVVGIIEIIVFSIAVNATMSSQ